MTPWSPLDPYTGGKGPQIVSGAATADSAMVLASPAETGARSVRPGHGQPWTEGAAAAVELAVRGRTERDLLAAGVTTR
ncbi:hypothetical protein AB0M34_15290 [Nocardia sp. NPDC050193]